MRMTKRLEALEAAAMKMHSADQLDIIHVIVAPDLSVVGAYRHNSTDGLVKITGDELEEIKQNS